MSGTAAPATSSQAGGSYWRKVVLALPTPGFPSVDWTTLNPRLFASDGSMSDSFDPVSKKNCCGAAPEMRTSTNGFLLPIFMGAHLPKTRVQARNKRKFIPKRYFGRTGSSQNMEKTTR